MLKLALAEAAQYGEARAKSVIGKAMAKFPELRASAKEVMPLIDEVVAKANQMDPKDLEPFLPEKRAKPKDEVAKELPTLQNSDKVVLRFAPGPSGPLHLGHTRALALNNYYRNRYGGKLILRLEDTNPNAIDPDAYDMIQSDMGWLGINPDEVVVQSDRIETYYDDMRAIISQGGAYVTNSDAEHWRELKNRSEAHPDRNRDSDVQLGEFESLLVGGEGIVVIKTDLEDSNPALRDFVAFRVVESPHPRQKDKYRLWPLYNYAVAIDDYRLGVTHVLRGKDHLNNTLKQKWIYKYMGWDDCRLATLKALARRGYQPETFLKYWENAGIKEVDIKFSWQNFNAVNKDLVDPVSRRLFFVPDPVEFKIETESSLVKEAPWHPGNLKLGMREEKVKSGDTVYLPGEEIQKATELRLKNLCNVMIEDKSLKFSGLDHKQGNPIIQWCCRHCKIELFYPDGNSVKGVVEDNISDLDGQVVQFERVGFVRLEGNKAFFLHR